MESKASNEVVRDVQQNGLCTGCGACVNLCPYFRNHRGKTVRLFECDRTWGRCYAYCPRTVLDLNTLQQKLYPEADLTDELGPFQALYMTQAADASIREGAQHGGTVTALVKLALDEGMIDTAVLAGEDTHQVGVPHTADKAGQARDFSKSKFILPPMVGKFNEAVRTDAQSIGIVAVPCQAQALAKMQVTPGPGEEGYMKKLKLVVGLFCGWAFDWEKLSKLLGSEVDGQSPILGMDIPPSKHKCMEVTTEDGMVCLPMDEIQKCVDESCGYCFDMTCEFSDLSVGAARSPEGWDEDRHWNQVIVRTETGRTLMELAREKGVLNFKDVPAGNLEKLKKASLNKKKSCLKYLTEKSGDPKDLIYLQQDDPVVKKVQDR